MFDETRQDEMMEVLWVLIEEYFGENAVACMLVNDGEKNMAFTNAEAEDILRMMQDTVTNSPFMNNDDNIITLDAKVRNLCDKDSEEWERKEIVVKYNAYLKYPNVRDEICLEDDEGNIYKLSFIKGANKEGWVCLGQPGKLKKWFIDNKIRNNQNIRLSLLSFNNNLFKLSL